MATDPVAVPSFSSFGTVCRTCLLTDQQGNLYPIEDVFWIGEVELKGIFDKWSPLKHNSEDELPQRVCYICVQLMFQVYKFFKKATESEAVLKSVLQQYKKIDTESEHIIIEVKEEHDGNTNHVNDDERSEDLSAKCEKEESVQDSNEILEVKNGENKFVKLLGRRRATKPASRCTTCLLTFRTVNELKQHRNQTHNRNHKYECEFCQLKCETKSSFAIHKRIHTGERPHECEVCHKTFITNSDLKRHAGLHSVQKPYKCGICGNEYSRKDSLADHERKQHVREKFVCDECGAEFNAPRTLSLHQNSAHATQWQTPEQSNEYRCRICSKTLKSVQALKIHVSAHGPKKHVCDYCQKAFSTTLLLKHHVRNTHESTRFECDRCGKVYRQKSGLTDHVIAHHSSTPFICEVCGKTFAFRGSLCDHRRIHTGDTKYQCPTCKKILPNNRRMQYHLAMHAGKKAHVCEFCGSRFRTRGNLSTHLLIHTKNRRRACHICDQVLADSRSLKRHIFRHKTNKSL